MDTKLVTKTLEDKMSQLQGAVLKAPSHLDITSFQKSLFINVSATASKLCLQCFFQLEIKFAELGLRVERVNVAAGGAIEFFKDS